MQTFKLYLSTTELNFVLETLGSLPAKSGVWPLIVKIQEQAAKPDEAVGGTD
jgi:hypothetical protein